MSSVSSRTTDSNSGPTPSGWTTSVHHFFQRFPREAYGQSPATIGVRNRHGGISDPNTAPLADSGTTHEPARSTSAFTRPERDQEDRNARPRSSAPSESRSRPPATGGSESILRDARKSSMARTPSSRPSAQAVAPERMVYTRGDPFSASLPTSPPARVAESHPSMFSSAAPTRRSSSGGTYAHGPHAQDTLPFTRYPQRQYWLPLKVSTPSPLEVQTQRYQATSGKFGDRFFSDLCTTLTYRLPLFLYLMLLFRMPVFYHGRVARVLEDAELSMAEVQKLARTTASGWKDKGRKERQEALAQLHHISNWSTAPQYASQVTPAMHRFRDSWETFIDSLLREWKTQNIISALLLSALVSMLQIDDAASDIVTRTACLLSLTAALMSLLYGCLYIIRFGTMKRMHKASAWAEEAQKQREAIWWNVWVLLAMPVVWLAWSLILFIFSIMSYAWRTGSHDTDRSKSDSATSATRISMACMFGLGMAYLIAMSVTFTRYGEGMDNAWKARLTSMVQQLLPEDSIYSSQGRPNSGRHSRPSQMDGMSLVQEITQSTAPPTILAHPRPLYAAPPQLRQSVIDLPGQSPYPQEQLVQPNPSGNPAFRPPSHVAMPYQLPRVDDPSVAESTSSTISHDFAPYGRLLPEGGPFIVVETSSMSDIPTSMPQVLESAFPRLVRFKNPATVVEFASSDAILTSAGSQTTQSSAASFESHRSRFSSGPSVMAPVALAPGPAATEIAHGPSGLHAAVEQEHTISETELSGDGRQIRDQDLLQVAHAMDFDGNGDTGARLLGRSRRLTKFIPHPIIELLRNPMWCMDYSSLLFDVVFPERGIERSDFLRFIRSLHEIALRHRAPPEALSPQNQALPPAVLHRDRIHVPCLHLVYEELKRWNMHLFRRHGMSAVLTYENRLRADDVYSVYVVDSSDALSMHPAQLKAMFAQSELTLGLDCERLVMHLLSCRPLSLGEPCIIHTDVVLDLQPVIDIRDFSSHDESFRSVASAHTSGGASSIHTYELELLQTPRAPQASSSMPSDGDANRDDDQDRVSLPLLDNEGAEAEEEEIILFPRLRPSSMSSTSFT
ncbi:uncharacterized protein SCHCODRAFT_02525771 [Schizophyllum commune H4-8]|nr:uncharacterized protein SCHCODRAFT_02525771 [Schizophyllum commune H4-8]KAI5900167.1 hypothetical protein SCHCODRAFT_02525771 [Schizophyllum commune H4-8]